MEAIVINRNLTKTEEDEILRLLKENEQSILYSNVEISPTLTTYSKGEFELTTDQKKEINYNIIDQVIQFGEYKIENTAIADLLTFEKVSIWHYHKFRIYFSIRNLFYDIELIKHIRSKYDKVNYYGENATLLKYPFKLPGIEIYCSRTKKSEFSVSTLLKYAIFFKIRVILGFFQCSSLKNKKHIIIDHAIKQTCLNIHSLQPEPGNPYIQYLLDKLDSNFLVLDDAEIPKMKSEANFTFNFSQLRAEKNRIFGEWIIFNGLLSSKTRKAWRNASKELEVQYDQIKANLQDPFYKLVIQQLMALHASSKLYLIKYLAYQKFLSKYKFKSITSIDENSARVKSILDAAKSNNIITVGIQHGTIHELHPAYIYSIEDQKRNIVPDYTMVWGKYWSDFLIEKGNYKRESLFVTGQIRTDIIQNLKSVKAQDYINTPKNSKIVVFASQPQRDPTLRKQAAFDVFSAVKDLGDVHLVVKLHPAEKFDIEYYNSIAQEAGCRNYQIILNIDLYLLISLSDIMITCFSTVGAETVYFNKPLIILDHLKQDIQGYHKEGIAFQATNETELKRYLVNILSGEMNINEVAYKNYIEEYAFKIDGKVADRIIKFVRSL